jgi:small-conductance mechanosensitive channel
MTLEDFLNYRLIDIEGYRLTVYRLLIILVIYLATRFLAWFVRKMMERRLLYMRRNMDNGRLQSIVQLTTYFIYITGITIALESIGLDISIFWAGSAALLVGVGLGLQQTFNDLICGLILLFEGNVKVGDIIQLDEGLIGKVTSIGLRTSTVETRDSIVIVVPNSKLIVENVINWTNNHRAARFVVSVGVAYESDVELVRQKLIEAAIAQPDVIKPDNQSPDTKHLEMPFVRFKNFGESTLDFEVLFWTVNAWDIEQLKSDIRFQIALLFREANISIAFPQRDIHIKVEEIPWEKLQTLQKSK